MPEYKILNMRSAKGADSGIWSGQKKKKNEQSISIQSWMSIFTE